MKINLIERDSLFTHALKTHNIRQSIYGKNCQNV